MQTARRSTTVHSFGSNMNGVLFLPLPPLPPPDAFRTGAAAASASSSSDSSFSVQSGEEESPPLLSSSSSPAPPPRVVVGGNAAASAARAAAAAASAGDDDGAVAAAAAEAEATPPPLPLRGWLLLPDVLLFMESGTKTVVTGMPAAETPPRQLLLLLSVAVLFLLSRGRLVQPCGPSAAPRTFIFFPPGPWCPWALSIMGVRRAAICGATPAPAAAAAVDDSELSAYEKGPEVVVVVEEGIPSPLLLMPTASCEWGRFTPEDENNGCGCDDRPPPPMMDAAAAAVEVGALCHPATLLLLLPPPPPSVVVVDRRNGGASMPNPCTYCCKPPPPPPADLTSST